MITLQKKSNFKDKVVKTLASYMGGEMTAVELCERLILETEAVDALWKQFKGFPSCPQWSESLNHYVEALLDLHDAVAEGGELLTPRSVWTNLEAADHLMSRAEIELENFCEDGEPDLEMVA